MSKSQARRLSSQGLLADHRGMINQSIWEAGNDRATHPAASERATVLVVDDYDDLRAFLAHLLQAAGYRVLEADGAQQAQRLAAAEGMIDVLVTDFNMPGMNGIELARWFQGRSPSGKVLLVSSETQELQAYLDAWGWFPFLDKAEAFTRLVPTVEDLVAEVSAESHGFGATQSARPASGSTTVLREMATLH
jgi:DNA-binding NtrC family response regulator